MAAITGLDIVYGEGTSAPSGYTKIKKDLNEGALGHYIYLCYSTSSDIGSPITAIQVGCATSPQDHRPGFKI